MNDSKRLQKTLFTFHHEASVPLKSSWSDSPRPIARFLSIIESDKTISAYLKDCVDNHIPQGFTASEEFDAVSRQMGSIFGPFSVVPEEESAQVYLILKELVERNIQGHSMLFYGYANGSKKYADMYKGFLDGVAQRLISNVESYLRLAGIEMGLDRASGHVTNSFHGPVGSAQINQSSGNAVIYASQNNGFDTQELNELLNGMFIAAKNSLNDVEVLEDIEETLVSIRDQMASDKPKRGIIRGAVSFLRGINAGAQFSAALAGLVEFLSNHGIPVLPSV